MIRKNIEILKRKKKNTSKQLAEKKIFQLLNIRVETAFSRLSPNIKETTLIREKVNYWISRCYFKFCFN